MHEHMDHFKLINMNGRVYDPVLAQFLSPDPFVANAASTVSYNRYAYCNYNPLKYVDPSGYLQEKPLFGDPNSVEYINIQIGPDRIRGGGNGSYYSVNGRGRSNFFWSIAEDLLSSNYGGSWSSSGGTHYYESDEEALGYGMAYVDYHNGWDYTEHKSSLATVLAYDNQQNIAETADLLSDFDPNSLLLASLGDPDGVPFIRSPYSYCESDNSFKNIYYWYQYYGNRVDQIFEGDCNDGVAPLGVRIFVSVYPYTSTWLNLYTVITGEDGLTDTPVSPVDRALSGISIVSKIKPSMLPTGTGTVINAYQIYKMPK